MTALESRTDPREPIRIGLLVDSLVQPAWVHEIVAELEAAPYAEIVLLVKNAAEPSRGGFLRKLWRQRDRLLYLAFLRLDRWLARPARDAFRPRSIETLVETCPVLEVEPIRKRYSDYLSDSDADRIAEARLDVALRFGFRIIKGRFLKIARYGVWSYHHGDNLVNRGGPPGFWEVMNREPTTGVVLQLLTERLDGGRVLCRSWGSTDRQLVTRNRNSCYWRSTGFVPRKIRELWERGAEILDEDPFTCGYAPYSGPLYRRPGNWKMAKLFVSWCARAARAHLRKLIWDDHWFVAYRLSPDASTDSPVFHRFTDLVPPGDRFWADPFPVERDGRHFVFFEEFLRPSRKGRICVFELTDEGRPLSPRVALERDYHLSYPFLYEWRGDLHMVPDTLGPRPIEWFRCVRFPDEWEKVASFAPDGLTTADATLHHDGTRWWMFVIGERPGASPDTELHLFSGPAPTGPWTPHRRNPVKSDARSARPAGALFVHRDTLYRPAQDCTGLYGRAITLNRVERLDEEEYREVEFLELEPNWRSGLLGHHTLNRAGRLTVVDGFRSRPRWRSSGTRFEDSGRPGGAPRGDR